MTLNTSGEATFDRRLAINFVTLTSGIVTMCYFTAQKSETVKSLGALSGTTAAGATPTLCKLGLYQADWTTGNLTLLASTANDTTLFAATDTNYTRAVTAPTPKVRGNRYAWAALVVTAAAAPTIIGGGSWATALTIAPRISGRLTGQTDLPASISAGSLTNLGGSPLGLILPT